MVALELVSAVQEGSLHQETTGCTYTKAPQQRAYGVNVSDYGVIAYLYGLLCRNEAGQFSLRPWPLPTVAAF